MDMIILIKVDIEEVKGSYTDGGKNISTKTLVDHSLTDIFETENNGLN